MSEACIFSTLDASYGHWQCEIDGRDKETTMFTSDNRLCILLRKPFVLKNAQERSSKRQPFYCQLPSVSFRLEYLNNVFIFLKPVEENLDHLRTVLGLLSRAGVLLKLKKCFFVKICMRYLCPVTTSSRLHILTKETYVNHGLQHSINLTEFKYFLRLVIVTRLSLPIFARRATLWSCKLKYDQKFHFRRLDGTAFEGGKFFRTGSFHCRYRHYEDQLEVLHMTLMPVTSRLGSFYCKSCQKHQQCTYTIGLDCLTKLNRHTTQRKKMSRCHFGLPIVDILSRSNSISDLNGQ